MASEVMMPGVRCKRADVEPLAGLKNSYKALAKDGFKKASYKKLLMKPKIAFTVVVEPQNLATSCSSSRSASNA